MPEGRTPVERLSRGEMQRVALARALLFAPPVVVADEPTASLDAESARLVGSLLVAMARGAGSTVLVVTHDPGLLARLDRDVSARRRPPRQRRGDGGVVINPLPLVLADLRRSRAGAAAVVALIGVAVALGVAVTAEERALRAGTARAADAFDLVVGARGQPRPARAQCRVSAAHAPGSRAG